MINEPYKILISKYEYVSFDIFDTLVKRNCMLPSDIFALTGRDVLGKGEAEKFRSERMHAEKIARKNDRFHEPNLSDIYSCLNGYSKEYLERLMSTEILQELEHCFEKKAGTELLQYAVSLEKHVLLISDMYLSTEVITKILQKCGVNTYEKLYISNTRKRSKYNGTLYNYVLSENHINASQLIHFGDNLKSDVIIPCRLGIMALPIRREHAIKRHLKAKRIEMMS